MDCCDFEDFDDEWEAISWIEKLEEDEFFRSLHGFETE
jgi:hypothetical protein